VGGRAGAEGTAANPMAGPLAVGDISGASVCFFHVKADGSFAVTTYASGDGCPAGAYALTVSWHKQVGAREGQEESDGPLVALLPPRFGRPETSGLRATVEKRPNELPPIYLKK
jgi:hypothetical protein